MKSKVSKRWIVRQLKCLRGHLSNKEYGKAETVAACLVSLLDSDDAKVKNDKER